MAGKCGNCGFSLDNHVGLRHYGTHVAHAEADCLRLLRQRIAELEAGEWIALTDRMPNPDEHSRVLIYTQSHDFNGEQVFDVSAESLNECAYTDPEDQPEVCRFATHWAPRPNMAALSGGGEA